MAVRKSIAVADLLLDQINPRLAQETDGQRECIRAIASLNDKKLLSLAQHIIDYGLNIGDLPHVMPDNENPDRFIVLEGNRRVAILKILENSELAVGVVSNNVLVELRRLSRIYQNKPVNTVSCVVHQTREEARPWIELRHIGQLEGAGTVRWNAQETARFRAMSGNGKPDFQQQVLDLLQQRGVLSPEERRQVRSTSLQRLLVTLEVREEIGIRNNEGDLELPQDESASKVALAALSYIADECRTLKVKDIYTKEQRIDYIKRLPWGKLGRTTQGANTSELSHHKPTSNSAPDQAPRQERPTSKPSPKFRDTLIPDECVLAIDNPRLRQIEQELRQLSLNRFTNAIGVMFRVFLELSLDAYITKKQLPVAVDVSLATKIHRVTDHLLKTAKINKQQANAVRRSAERDSYLGPSITLMHAYIHNQYMFPVPTDLRNDWNTLQPFFVAIWSNRTSTG